MFQITYNLTVPEISVNLDKKLRFYVPQSFIVPATGFEPTAAQLENEHSPFKNG